MAQLAAEGLGVKMNDVRVNMADTDCSPYEWQTVASRLTWSMGNAVLRAADSARSQILQTVAEAWGEDVGDLDVIDGQVISYKTEESRPLKDLSSTAYPDGTWTGGPVVGQDVSCPSTSLRWIQRRARAARSRAFHHRMWAVEVEVDTRRRIKC
jgi:CO/xanthine dehydrogenase Mo-binding subunit